MDHTGAAFFLSIALYLAVASFTYLVKNYKGARRKENLFVFFCTFNCFVLSVFIFVLELLNEGHYYNIESKFLCALVPLVFKFFIIASKVYQNLIFTYRYKTVNRTVKIAAAKRAGVFSVVIVVFSIVEFAADVAYFAWVNTNSDDCVSDEKFFEKNLYYGYVQIGNFSSKIFFQTLVSAYVIKPISSHFFNRDMPTGMSSKLKATLYRMIWCTLQLTASDVILVFVYVTCVTTSRIGAPVCVLCNLMADVVLLVFSYGDNKRRLFPFVETASGEQSGDSLVESKGREKGNKKKSTESSLV